MGEDAGLRLGEESGAGRTKPAKAPLWFKVLSLVFLAVLLPVLIVWEILRLLWTSFLYLAVWIAWCGRGRNILLVYSNSPIWQAYFERDILPRLGRRAVVLNWSERRKWRPSLATLVFGRFAGRENFNPLALVFWRFQRVQKFQFYEAFKEYKHGHVGAVETIKDRLFASLRLDR